MKKRRMFVGIYLLALALLAAACVAPEPAGGQIEETGTVEATTDLQETDRVRPSPTPTATPEDERLRERATPEPSRLPERVPPPQETAATDEVPEEIMSDIVDAVVERMGADRATIEVLRSEAVVWRDGSLGCPQPGMVYTQALVEGYWVVLRVGEQEYDFRVTESGAFRLCENGRLPSPLPGDAGEGSSPNE